MRGKIALEEHFAIPETLQDSAGFVPRGFWTELSSRIMDIQERGEYSFRTVKPRWYPIPDDGPVGRLLAALDRHPNRAAHLHFMISASGFETVITHSFTGTSYSCGRMALELNFHNHRIGSCIILTT